MSFSPRLLGLGAAAVTVAIWTSFIVIARASAAHTLLPLDLALLRICGASVILLPWAWWMTHRKGHVATGSLGGLSPLPLNMTMQAGALGGLLYAMLAYYSVTVRRRGLDPVRATMAITAFACVVYVPSYLLAVLTGLVPSHLSQAPVSEWLFQAMFQGWGSVVISGITFTQMVSYYGPVRSTMITALVPGLSALGAVMFLGEPMHWQVLLGLALVTAGILFGVRQARAPALKKVTT